MDICFLKAWFGVVRAEMRTAYSLGLRSVLFKAIFVVLREVVRASRSFCRDSAAVMSAMRDGPMSLTDSDETCADWSPNES